MSAPNVIGVAFLGVGRMGETHLRNLAGLNGVRVVAVADPNGEAAERPPSLKFLLSSGGLFLDMAVHDLDLARFLVGEVEEVQAWGSVLIDERFAQANDADTAVTLLRFNNGVLGVTETSRRSNWGYDIRTEVAGSIGKVVIEAPQKTPLLFARDFASSYDHFANFPERFDQAYRLQLEAFFRDLQAGRKPSPGPEDALETLRLAIAVTKSWREGRPVKVSEIQT
jgi:myo-inositol 2-dehydrogenase/D-chiro-inositol 1-dehydrogenase